MVDQARNERDVRTREQGPCQVSVSQGQQPTSVTFEGGLWVPLCRSRCSAHALVSVVPFTCVVFRAGVGVCVDGPLARGVPRMRMRGRTGGGRYRGASGHPIPDHSTDVQNRENLFSRERESVGGVSEKRGVPFWRKLPSEGTLCVGYRLHWSHRLQLG